MELIIIWIGCGILSALVASNKARSGFGWFLIGFLFGPLGFIASLIVPSLKTQAPQIIYVHDSPQNTAMGPRPRPGFVTTQQPAQDQPDVGAFAQAIVVAFAAAGIIIVAMTLLG